MKQADFTKYLLILGCGYVGLKLAQRCLTQGFKVKATTRNPEQVLRLQALGIETVLNDNPALLTPEWLADCDTLLDSIPLTYDTQKKPSQTQAQWVDALLNKMPNLSWVGYLSSTGVYADSQGEWIDETSTAYSSSKRGVERIKAEQSWLNSGAPAEVFRLAGIYGDERNILNKLFAGNYKTVAWNPAHYSNRIHVDDIISALLAAKSKPQNQRIINLSDDAPCSHAQYSCELAKLIGAPAPVILTPQQAKEQLSTSYLDFFRDSKRISNQKLHQELLAKLKYPSFRDAVPSLIHTPHP